MANYSLAEKAFSRFTGPNQELSAAEYAEVNKALEGCNSQQEIMVRITEICGEPSSPKEILLVATAYSWAGAKYREQTIKYFLKYLSSDTLSETEFNNRHRLLRGIRTTPTEERNIHLADCYRMLGSAYEGEYRFDEALSACNEAVRLAPFFSSTYYHKVAILVKQGKMAEAMEVYKTAKKSPFYPPAVYKNILGETVKENDFGRAIDTGIQDLKNKIAKGYVYKPRKPKKAP